MQKRDVSAFLLSFFDVRTQFRSKRVCKLWNQIVNTTSWPKEYEQIQKKKFPWLVFMLYNGQNYH